MMLVASAIIFLLSLILALRSAERELSIPESVKKIRIRKRPKFSGVILFLKEKVIHHSSASSS